jgi:hypothetical protein
MRICVAASRLPLPGAAAAAEAFSAAAAAAAVPVNGAPAKHYSERAVQAAAAAARGRWG